MLFFKTLFVDITVKMKCVGADDGNNIPCQRCKRSGAEYVYSHSITVPCPNGSQMYIREAPSRSKTRFKVSRGCIYAC